MTNEHRAERVIQKYGFDFSAIPKEEIISLLQAELEEFQEGSSEYIRLLCGYLYCLGDRSDLPLLERAKYGVNMDVGCMVDWEWLESLKNGGVETPCVRSREEIIRCFTEYYQSFAAEEQEDG